MPTWNASPPRTRGPHARAASVVCSLLAASLAGCSEEGSEQELQPAFSGPSPVRFVECAAEAGIDFDHDQGRSEELYMVESLMAGAIFFDAEGDGDQDLYFLNGSLIGVPPDESTPLDAFYTNQGPGERIGHFQDDTERSGLGDPRFANGVCGADYDNDGDVDLYVTNFEAPNALFRNDGTGRFVDVAADARVEGTRPTDASPGFADLDADGWLDLFVCNYNDHSLAYHYRCQQPKRDGSGPGRRYCTVERYNPVDSVLYRSLGDGTFEDVSAQSGIGGHVARAFGVSFADYDLDGDSDIFVASDRSPNLLFENKGDFVFDEIGQQAGVAVDRDGKARAGMGVVSGDLDLDGDFDLAVTYFEAEVNGFYENQGGNRFTAWEGTNGTARPSFPYVGWGVDFFDADLDTDLDCYVVNGHYIDNAAWFREPIAPYEQPGLFYLNDGQGDFTFLNGAEGLGLDAAVPGRGLAVADYDNDGDMDALVLVLDGAPRLWRNDTPRAGRHWLTVRTVGTRGNRDGIGARLSAHLDDRVLVREVRSAQSYLCQGDLRQHFGLGERTHVPRLEVRWPSGALTVLENVQADQILTVVEPQ